MSESDAPSEREVLLAQHHEREEENNRLLEENRQRLELAEPGQQVASTPTDLLALALEKGVDTETLGKFMDLQERYEAGEARKAYAADMVKCQKAMPAVLASSPNDQTESFYAKLGQITRVVTPIYTKHGFSISFGEAVAAKEGDIRITARVLHKLGHFEDFFYDLPPDVAGPQGTINKTPIHGKGSSTTYAQRYLTKMIWNLSIVGIDEEDDDGNAAGGPAPGRITEEQAMELDALCTENEVNHKGIQREFRVAGWPQIPVEKFEKVKSRITGIIEKRKERR